MDQVRYRFGLFEFDTASRELRREGILVRLQAQPAQVLSCLIVSSGKVVSREELCEAVWGQETFVDFDRSLNFCVSQIRSALRDDSTTPHYVRTVPRRGYEFIAPVERIPDMKEAVQRASVVWKLPTRLVLASSLGLLMAISVGAGYWARSRAEQKRLPIIAVVRFDNETDNAGMTRFSDGLTDSIVERLTSQSERRYGVIGNASILRLPRGQRDLNAIASSLHAGYVVLGQVQSDGEQTRILAHLIRLPDQEHLWVARMDRAQGNVLDVEAESAQKIASEFSWRVVKDATGPPLPPLPRN